MSLSLSLLDASVAQVAIAWLLHQSAVSSVVIGARTVSQLQDNLKAAQLKLSPEEASVDLRKEREKGWNKENVKGFC